MKLGLRNKFLIPTVFLVVAGMAFSTTLSYFNAKDALDRSIKDHISKITDSTVDRLNTWAERTRLDLSNWAKSHVYRSSVKKDFMGKTARNAEIISRRRCMCLHSAVIHLGCNIFSPLVPVSRGHVDE